jgi:hypothetical protein
VAEADFIESLPQELNTQWIQTSYNTVANTHPEDSPLRKNFAGIGFSYDPVLDAFIPPIPQIAPPPGAEWIIDSETGMWAPNNTAPSGARWCFDQLNLCFYDPGAEDADQVIQGGTRVLP